MTPLDELHSLQAHAQKVILSLHAAVTKHAVVQTPLGGGSAETVLHDFQWFAVCKATRSLDAADRLITMSLGEDALVVLRTVYEAYLHLSFISANPHRVNDLVAAKVGMYAGLYAHPKSKKGRVVWNQVVNPETGQPSPHGVAIPELVSAGRHPLDRPLHDTLYAFLSEHAHVHMIAIGAYRTPEAKRLFATPGPASIYSAVLMIAYLSWLIGSETLELVASRRPNIRKQVLDGVALRIRRSLEGAGWDEPFARAPDQMTARLTSG